MGEYGGIGGRNRVYRIWYTINPRNNGDNRVPSLWEEKRIKAGGNFFYIKGLAGHQQYNPGRGDGFLSAAEVPAATYYGLGTGVGRHISFNWFFIELSTGAKYVYSDVPQPDFFYITGPGAIFDLHFNFGFQVKKKQ